MNICRSLAPVAQRQWRKVLWNVFLTWTCSKIVSFVVLLRVMIRKYREPHEVNRTEHNEIEILKTNWKQYYKSTFTMPWWVIILTMVLRLIACCLCSTTKHSIVSPLMVENFQRIVLIRREGSLSCQTRWGTRAWINSLSPLTTFYFLQMSMSGW